MNKVEWNKLVARKLLPEEKVHFGDNVSSIWEGVTPDVDEEVLVYTPEIGVTTDTWIDYGNGVGFENYDYDVIYWTSFPEPPKGFLLNNTER